MITISLISAGRDPDTYLVAASAAGTFSPAEPAEQDNLVIPESPKQPADNSLAPGRLSASRPVPASDQLQLPCNEDMDIGHAAAEPSFDLTQTVASKVHHALPPIYASDQGPSSNEHRLDSMQLPHNKLAEMVPDVKAGEQAAHAANSSANNPLQPAEFDIIVDAPPAGKSSMLQSMPAISALVMCVIMAHVND